MNLFSEMLKEVDDNVLCECASALASLKRYSVQGPSVKIEVHMQVSLEKRLEMLKEKQRPQRKKTLRVCIACILQAKLLGF